MGLPDRRDPDRPPGRGPRSARDRRCAPVAQRRTGGFGELQRAVRYLSAQLAAARGDLEGALATLQDTERIFSALDDSYLSGFLAWKWAEVYLDVGRSDAARDMLARLEQQCAVTRHALLLLARDWLTARLLCAEGRHRRALVVLEEAIARARATKGLGERIRLLAIQAMALYATGDRPRSRARPGVGWAAMPSALDLASLLVQPESYAA